MAHLGSYYTLCPLIDQQNLLGVQADSKPGCAIVTLGRNIVIRYKLQDLKQVTSWSSKDRLTTPVIYDELTQNYVAVFNEKYIRAWEEKETDLDSIKKFKFPSPISAIHTLKGISPIVVLQNGATASLAWACENKKTWTSSGSLTSAEKILNSKLVYIEDKIYLCMFTKDEKTFNYVVVPLKPDNYTEDVDQLLRIELKRSTEKLVGHVILQDNKNAYLLTLWSHGRLYSYPLTGSSSESSPGMLISVIGIVNTNHPVTMVALNESTIALYGADTNEEGAVLCIYNVQFKIVQAVQKLKLFTQDAKLWNIEDKILLAANRHLAIAPYSLAQQRIEAMLGSTCKSKNEVSTDDEIVVVEESTIGDWGIVPKTKTVHKLPLKSLNKEIANKISTFLNEGMSDASIQDNLIPYLFESKISLDEKIKHIVWCLDNLNDLTDEKLVKLLVFCLEKCVDPRTFQTLQNGFAENSEPHEDNSSNEFLNKILNIPFVHTSLVSHLRSEVKLEHILSLLNYFNHNFNNNNQTQLKNWTSAIIDSHYQHFLLREDKNIKLSFDTLVEALKKQMEKENNLANEVSVTAQLMKGRVTKRPLANINRRYYSIEEIKFPRGSGEVATEEENKNISGFLDESLSVVAEEKAQENCQNENNQRQLKKNKKKHRTTSLNDSIKEDQEQQIIQGLQNGNVNIFSQLPETKKESFIKTLTPKLHVPEIVFLLKLITPLLDENNQNESIAYLWWVEIRSVHAATLISLPSKEKVIGPILEIFQKNEIEIMKSTKLLGKLEFVAGQLAQREEKQEKDLTDECLLVYDNEDSSDEDVDINKAELSSESGDSDWEETSEQEPMQVDMVNGKSDEEASIYSSE